MTTMISQRKPALSAEGEDRAVLGRVRVRHPRMLRFWVPIDFTGRSPRAILYAAAMAAKFNGKVHLVHVLPVVKKQTEADLAKARAQALDKLDERARTQIPVEVRGAPEVLEGVPDEAILKAARKNQVDMIVLYRSERKGLKQRLFGAVSDRIVWGAECPVVVVGRL